MKTPSLGRINAVLILGIAIVVMLHFARPFLIPFAAGIILSMLVLPICKKLEGWGWPRGWAILVCIIILIAGGVGLLMVMAAPIGSFNEDLPQLRSSFEEKITQVQQFLAQKLNISVQKQNDMMEQTSSALSSAGKYLAGFLSGFFGFLFDIILMLVYISFFLYSRERYENFVVKLNQENDDKEVRQVLHQISQVSTQYLIGRLLSIFILAVLYTLGLMVIGLKHAILLGSMAAMLTIVPYVGTTLGGVFPAAATFLSGGEGPSPIAAIAVIFVVQLLDDYVLEPFVVGEKVNLSPLAIIVGIVVGGLIWGVAGMILFIPLLGMTKIVFDHVPALHPYAYLIGKEKSKEKAYVQKIKQWFSKIFQARKGS